MSRWMSTMFVVFCDSLSGKVEQLRQKFPFQFGLNLPNMPWQFSVCICVVIAQLSPRNPLDVFLTRCQCVVSSSMLCVSNQSSLHMTHAQRTQDVRQGSASSAVAGTVIKKKRKKGGACRCFPAQTESDRTKKNVNMHYLQQQENSSFLQD